MSYGQLQKIVLGVEINRHIQHPRNRNTNKIHE